jgi:hypothetical protein
MIPIFLYFLYILIFSVEVFLHLQIISSKLPIIHISFFIDRFSTFHNEYVFFTYGQHNFKVYLFQIFICLLFHYWKQNFIHDSI